jgi:uncharacterized DUF497 family protein
LEITFDPGKRALTLRHRGLDFARAAEVFAGRTATAVDDRRDYGETRLITAGRLDGRLVAMSLDAISAFTRVFDALWRRGPPRHLDEALSCRGRRNLAPPHGLIATTRRR